MNDSPPLCGTFFRAFAGIQSWSLVSSFIAICANDSAKLSSSTPLRCLFNITLIPTQFLTRKVRFGAVKKDTCQRVFAVAVLTAVTVV